jgi:hypothetical protein
MMSQTMPKPKQQEKHVHVHRQQQPASRPKHMELAHVAPTPKPFRHAPVLALVPLAMSARIGPVPGGGLTGATAAGGVGAVGCCDLRLTAVLIHDPYYYSPGTSGLVMHC